MKINEYFTENILNDSLKSAQKVDPTKTKQAFINAPNMAAIGDMMNQDTLNNVEDKIRSIDSHMSKNKVESKSIVARAKHSVLQFPVYISSGIRVNEAAILSGMFERVYTTLVQSVLSQNPIISEEEANNLIFLRKFHSNITEATEAMVNEFYKPIDELDEMMQESIFHRSVINENCIVEFRHVNKLEKDIVLECARLCNEPLTGFAYLMEATDKDTEKVTTTEKNTSNRRVSDDEFADLAAEMFNIPEKDLQLFKKGLSKNLTDDEKEQYDDSKKLVNDSITRVKNVLKAGYYSNFDKEKYEKLPKDVKDDLMNNKNILKEYRYSNGRFEHIDSSIKSTTQVKEKDKADKLYELKPVRATPAPTLLKDKDIKKLNSMDPYGMVATFMIKTKTGLQKEIQYVLGIKTVLHLINSKDLSEEMYNIMSGDNKGLQKVRYKTGEISFADYFLNLKQLKADAAKNINYNKKWINHLKHLGDYKNLYGTLFNKPLSVINRSGVPIPNGTLIVTDQDVQMIKDDNGIDLANIRTAKQLCSKLFLIAIAIMDPSEGTLKVLFPESDNDWSVQSLDQLASEVARSDSNKELFKELKKIINR